MNRNLLLKLAVSSFVLGVATSGCSGMATGSASTAPTVGKPALAAKSADKARAALTQGNAAKAVTLAEAAVAAAPRDGGYRALLGQAYLNDGRFQSAATAFGEAMDLNMTDPQTVIGLALAQIALARNAEAIALVSKYRDSLPASDAGLALALAGDLESSIYVLTEASRQEGAGARTRQNLALALALSGRWVQARIIASQDLSLAKIDARMAEWSMLAQQSHPGIRVANLIGVKPKADNGMPVRLALSNFAAPAALAAADPAPVAGEEALILASVDPAPVAQFAPPPPAADPATEAMATPAIRSIELPMPVRTADGVVPVTELPSPSDAKPAQGQIILAEAAPYRVAPRVAGAEAAARRLYMRPTQAEARAMVADLMKPTATFNAKKPSGWAVQLGAYDSLAVAKGKWTSLSARNAALKGFPASSHSATVKGKRFYRLTVNGLASRADASNLCRSLQAARQKCFIRQMVGTESVQWASRGSVRVASR